jgi:hypothetical protein
VSGGVVGPPRAGVPTQLLCGEEGYLYFGAAQEPELGLHHLKPVIGLGGSPASVKSRKVTVGGWSGSGSISCLIASMSRVGHELSQQLGLLIAGLKDRGNRLSQT